MSLLKTFQRLPLFQRLLPRSHIVALKVCHAGGPAPLHLRSLQLATVASLLLTQPHHSLCPDHSSFRHPHGNNSFTSFKPLHEARLIRVDVSCHSLHNSTLLPSVTLLALSPAFLLFTVLSSLTYYTRRFVCRLSPTEFKVP